MFVLRHDLLGTTVDAVTSWELIDAAVLGIESGKRNQIVGNHNLHSLHLFHNLPELSNFYSRCYLTHIDGMSLILLGRLLGLPLRRCHRTTYLDWIEDFVEVVSLRQWKMYVIGGTAENALLISSFLSARYPKLKFMTHHGYLSANDNEAIYQEIQDFAPHIVMVGMGMPTQEQWILRSLPFLDTRMIFTCGAAFQYLAGVKYRPPRWAGQLGVEWLFRLASEPRRLASRYLLEPIQLLPLLLRAAVGRLDHGPSSVP